MHTFRRGRSAAAPQPSTLDTYLYGSGRSGYDRRSSLRGAAHHCASGSKTFAGRPPLISGSNRSGGLDRSARL